MPEVLFITVVSMLITDLRCLITPLSPDAVPTTEADAGSGINRELKSRWWTSAKGI